MPFLITAKPLPKRGTPGGEKRMQRKQEKINIALVVFLNKIGRKQKKSASKIRTKAFSSL